MVAVGAGDPVVRLYRLLLVFGVIGVVILATGLAEFLYFEPFGDRAAVQTRVVGVYQYDPATHKVVGPDRRTFARDESFASVVDWSTLPDSITVQAVWFDSFENVVGRVGPAHPSALAGDTVIAAAVPAGLKYHLPGEYIFAVERLNGGQPIEVLARRIVLVER